MSLWNPVEASNFTIIETCDHPVVGPLLIHSENTAHQDPLICHTNAENESQRSSSKLEKVMSNFPNIKMGTV
jgi:hypothetical protein